VLLFVWGRIAANGAYLAVLFSPFGVKSNRIAGIAVERDACVFEDTVWLSASDEVDASLKIGVLNVLVDFKPARKVRRKFFSILFPFLSIMTAPS
jgi:hypothetical protein